MRKATRAQWIKCAIAIILYLIFLVWVKSWWGLIVVPFIFDIYITKKVPWSFWKKSKNPTVRSVMSWVDAIVFALVAVYFVNIYIFQNYQIPSSSLEKSLLVGDFLLRQQDELRPPGTEYPTLHAVGTAHTTYYQHQIIHRVASMGIQACSRIRKSQNE